MILPADPAEAGQVLAQRTFSADDQALFAWLSGDRNSIHLDPFAARRSIAGELVVHGIHSVLWALEEFLSRFPALPAISNLKVRFERMLLLHRQTQVSLVALNDRSARIDVEQAGHAGVVILISFGNPTDAAGIDHGEPLPRFEKPLERVYNKLGAEGCVIFSEAEPLTTAFPQVAHHIGCRRLQGLAATSYIVGMVCPGRWSIYRTLNVIATNDRKETDHFSFRIVHVDLRFRLIRCCLDSAGWTGSFEAHDAPEPISQPTMNALKKRVGNGEFAGINALVIGGSRGLGELVGKLLTAGDAKVLLTYHVGLEDALKVQAEIQHAGGLAMIGRYDVLSECEEKIDPLAFDQIYFMASPPITKVSEHEQTSVTQSYGAIFVDAFARLCTQIAKRPHSSLSIFYPSSVFVEQTQDGFGAYALAKKQGEELCARMQADMLPDRILMRRLPPILTDQTQSLFHQKVADGIEIMLPIIRAMRKMV